MGKAWDRYTPAGFQAWSARWAAECLRVCRPGAHLVAFGGTRTWHRLACALEDADWEVRDTLVWLYGQGFPKSLDVSKAFDKAAGVKRPVVGVVKKTHIGGEHPGEAWARPSHFNADGSPVRRMNITAAATDLARQWSGWGTALKPGWEPILLCRKPLSERNVAANVARWGTGGINIDDCRLLIADCKDQWTARKGRSPNGIYGNGTNDTPSEPNALGRWPANVCLDEPAAEMLDAQSGETSTSSPRVAYHSGLPASRAKGEETGHETLAAFGDSGGASRFFYCPKAGRREREAGLAGLPAGRPPGEFKMRNGSGEPCNGTGERSAVRNHHPTVKPVALMRWLCRLVCPPGGLVLDPFLGSGTTGMAAALEGLPFLGIEREAEYVAIARRRIRHARRHPDFFPDRTAARPSPAGRGANHDLALGKRSHRRTGGPDRAGDLFRPDPTRALTRAFVQPQLT